jgi:hypothetical protein
MEARFDAACRIAGALMAQGKVVFSPIVHTHPIAVRCALSRGWDYWQRYDREMIAHADKVLVVKIDGWQESKGIAGEIAIALQLGIPVEYMEWSL